MKAIIFDFDGVIHDTQELGFEIAQKSHPGITKERFLANLETNLFEDVEEDFEEKHKKFRELEYEAFKKLKLERKIRKELLKLKEDYDLYIISSNSIRNLSIYFENNKFTDVFIEILAAETHRSKEEKFKILFEKYGLNKESCIFITDTLGDLIEANKVGVKSIAVDFGAHNREKLEKGKPKEIVSNFKDIRSAIEKIIIETKGLYARSK